MTKEAMAGRLNGRQYRDEMTKDDEREAADSGLIVIFGASDDLIEFSGAVIDEIDMYDGGKFRLDAQGPVPSERDNDWDDDEMATYLARKKRAVTVTAEWSGPSVFAWAFKSPVPCATFEIFEEDVPYCQGIVIDTRDLPGYVDRERD